MYQRRQQCIAREKSNLKLTDETCYQYIILLGIFEVENFTPNTINVLNNFSIVCDVNRFILFKLENNKTFTTTLYGHSVITSRHLPYTTII